MRRSNLRPKKDGIKNTHSFGSLEIRPQRKKKKKIMIEKKKEGIVSYYHEGIDPWPLKERGSNRNSPEEEGIEDPFTYKRK